MHGTCIKIMLDKIFGGQRNDQYRVPYRIYWF